MADKTLSTPQRSEGDPFMPVPGLKRLLRVGGQLVLWSPCSLMPSAATLPPTPRLCVKPQRGGGVGGCTRNHTHSGLACYFDNNFYRCDGGKKNATPSEQLATHASHASCLQLRSFWKK